MGSSSVVMINFPSPGRDGFAKTAPAVNKIRTTTPPKTNPTARGRAQTPQLPPAGPTYENFGDTVLSLGRPKSKKPATKDHPLLSSSVSGLLLQRGGGGHS